MKFATAFLMLLFSTFWISATEIFLSSTGNDNNSGLTEEIPVKTLAKALELISSAEDNSAIKVLDFINISEEISDKNGITINSATKFTIEGKSKITAGFDGNNTTRILNIQGFSGTIALKNMTLRNGSSDEGGAVRILNTTGNITVESCLFSDNTSTSTGTLHLYRATATIRNCDFTQNKAKFGGGIYLGNEASVEIDSCKIINNDLSATNGSMGGGIYMKETKGVVITNSIIRDNKANGQGGGITILNTSADNDAVSILNTLIASNESTNNAGGGIFINNGTANSKINVSVINSTVYGNLSKTYGGAVFTQGIASGSALNLINCTIIENQTQGNGGHGAGLCFRDASQSIETHIYNCIIESNSAINGGNTIYSDLASNYNFSNGSIDDFVLRNSYVGAILASAANYKDETEYNNTIKYGNTQAAGLAKPATDYITSQNSVPLDFDSEALDKGNAKFLKDLSINTDQLGKIRQFKNDKCAVGAVEVPAELVITDPELLDYQHFFIYGQSLSVGQESFYPLSTENIEGNYMIGEQVWMNYGNKNVDQLNPLVATPAISIQRTCENPITGAVNHVRKKQEQESPEIINRFIATSSGTGARPIADLSKGSTAGLYERDFLPALKQGKKITVRRGSTISSPAIFWLQGENDYNATQMPKDEYKAALVKLKNDMQSDIMDTYEQESKPVFFTYQTGGSWTNGNKELKIGMAQLEASNQYDDIICVGPTYHLSFSYNNHLCSNGSRWFGEYMGKVYYKTQVLGEDFKPLQPKALYRDSQDPKKVIIKFHVPQLPLVFDESILEKQQNYGFSVYMNNSKQTISNVRIVDDCVEITCSNNLTGNLEVIYAEKNAVNGKGNLRDSDNYQAMFNYVDADAKDQSDNYIYPRIDGYESLRPMTPEPKDENGNIIYDKPYPLYNFCLAFNYPLAQGVAEYKVPYIDGNGSGIESIQGRELEIKCYNSQLQIYSEKTTSLNLCIYDLSGKAIFKDSVKPFNGLKQYDLSVLEQGIYVVKTISDNGTNSMKISVNR